MAGNAELGETFSEAAQAQGLGPLLQRRRARADQEFEGAFRGDHREPGPVRAGAEARTRRGSATWSSRSSSSSSCMVGAIRRYAADPPSTPGRAGRFRLRRTRPGRVTWPMPTGSCGPSSTACNSSKSSKPTPFLSNPPPRNGSRGSSGSRTIPGPPPPHNSKRHCGLQDRGALAARTALLPTLLEAFAAQPASDRSRSDTRAGVRRAGMSAEQISDRLRAFGFAGRRTDQGRSRRAGTGSHPQLAAHGPDAAVTPRLAVCHTRSRPRSPRAAQPCSCSRTTGTTRHYLPRVSRSGPAPLPAPRIEPTLGEAVAHNPELMARLGDDDALALSPPQELQHELLDRMRSPRGELGRQGADSSGSTRSNSFESAHATCSTWTTSPRPSRAQRRRRGDPRSCDRPQNPRFRSA